MVLDAVAGAEENTMNANPRGVHTVLALTFANVEKAVVLAVATVPSARAQEERPGMAFRYAGGRRGYALAARRPQRAGGDSGDAGDFRRARIDGANRCARTFCRVF